GDTPDSLCGRKVNAHGLCSTHNRQKPPLRPIRPVSSPSPHASLHGYGLRWKSAETLAKLEAEADRRGMTPSALIVETLETAFGPKRKR
ncbi:hypothetical protein, partial [Corallococcus terminator]